jgi:hypothetical protein
MITTTEHLQLIKAECERLLAIAEKRTQGEWSVFYGGGKTIAVDIGATPHGKRPNIVDWCGFDQNDLPKKESLTNARFIAACAGRAEAGWEATIAAIDALESMAAIPMDISILQLTKDILAAWPIELLTKNQQ